MQAHSVSHLSKDPNGAAEVDSRERPMDKGRYQGMGEGGWLPHQQGPVHGLHPHYALTDGQDMIVLDVDWPVQVGYAQEQEPRGVFPPVVGRPKDDGSVVGMGLKDTYVGDEARDHRGILQIRIPVERGMVVNWEDWEKIVWHCLYQELRTTPPALPLLLLESPGMTPASRERACRILLETFQVPALSVMSRPVAAVCAQGCALGVNVHVGRAHSWVVPVVEGYPLAYASLTLGYGRRTIIDYLMELLVRRGESFSSYYSHDVFEDMLTRHAFVAPHGLVERESLSGGQAEEGEREEVAYELPDGKIVLLGRERYQSQEGLFQPGRWGMEEERSLGEAVCECVLACAGSLRAPLLRHIVVSGHYVEGLASRLQEEVAWRLGESSSVEVNVSNPPDALSLPWVGGCVCASLGLPSLTPAQYDEHGPRAIRESFPCLGYWEDGSLVPAKGSSGRERE